MRSTLDPRLAGAWSRLNRVCGYRHLPRLREALQREIRIGKEVVAA